jgi:replicative DNA helicase
MKSTLCDGIISSSVEYENSIGLIISLEDSKEDRIARIVASRTGMSLRGIRFRTVKISEKQILTVLEGRFGNRLLVVDKRDVSTPEQCCAMIDRVRPDIWAIDHLQKFVFQDMIMGIKNAIDKLEHMALLTSSHGMIFSQVADKVISKREIKRITSSDSQWNSSLYQSATELVSLWYPYKISKNEMAQHILEVEILESRFFPTSTGIIKLHIDVDTALIRGELGKTGVDTL